MSDLFLESQKADKLEFDREGKLRINLEGLIHLELSRTGGLKLKPRGHSKLHLVDYSLVNWAGITKGNFFFFAPGIKSILPSEVPFEIMPGFNLLELAVYSIDNPNPEDKQSSFYRFQVDGRVYRNGRIIFIMEDYTKHYSDEFLDRMAQLAILFQSDFVDHGKILRFKLTTDRSGFSQHYNGDVEIAHSEMAKHGICSERFVERTLTHEMTHNFYEQLNDSGQINLHEDFIGFYNQNLANGNFGKKRFLGRIAGESSWTFDDGCVMALFMERYYTGESQDAGHPWDHASELFASATEIMRCHASELFTKIQALSTQKDKDLVKEVMSKVTGLYRRYCKTGDTLFPKEVLTYVN